MTRCVLGGWRDDGVCVCVCWKAGVVSGLDKSPSLDPYLRNGNLEIRLLILICAIFRPFYIYI